MLKVPEELGFIAELGAGGFKQKSRRRLPSRIRARRNYAQGFSN